MTVSLDVHIPSMHIVFLLCCLFMTASASWDGGIVLKTNPVTMMAAMITRKKDVESIL